LNQPDLIRAHLNKAARAIHPFGVLKTFLGKFRVWVSVALGLVVIHQTFYGSAAVMVLVSGHFLMPVLMSVARYFINRRLRRFLNKGGSAGGTK